DPDRHGEKTVARFVGRGGRLVEHLQLGELKSHVQPDRTHRRIVMSADPAGQVRVQEPDVEAVAGNVARVAKNRAAELAGERNAQLDRRRPARETYRRRPASEQS